MNGLQRVEAQREIAKTENGGLQKGDVVKTQTFGLRYRVLRVWHGKALCEPLSQPQWKDHFMFPVAYLEKEVSGAASSAAPAVRLVWMRVDWSIWAHARMANDLTACGRHLSGGEPVEPAPGDDACALCLSALRGSEGEA